MLFLYSVDLIKNTENAMNKKFTKTDIDAISNILGMPYQKMDSSWAWKLINSETKQTLVFSIFKNLV